MPLIKETEIGQGLQFPPERDRRRVNIMERYARYSDRRYQGLVGNVIEGEHNRLQPNVFRFIMEFWQDTIMADAPVIDYAGSDRQNEFLAALRPSLIEASRLVVGDLIRYGCGVYLNKEPLAVQVVDPRYWYPVRVPYDEGEGDVDVIAYPYAVGDIPSTNSRTAQRSFEATGASPAPGAPITQLGQAGHFPDHLAVTVYRPGRGVRTLYHLNALTIGAPAADPMTIAAGAPAVVAVREGDGFYGVSDFADIEEYVAELHQRETRVSHALDRHTNPHLAVPEGVMQTDEQGRIVVNDEGMAIPVPEGAVAPSYVIWDPSFDAQKDSMERAFERILHASKIAPVLVNAQRGFGQIPSGSALRRLAIPTVNRIRAIREKLTEAIRDVIVGQAALHAAAGREVIDIDPLKVNLQWPAELSSGITDEADAIATLVGAGVLEQERAIELVSKLNRPEAERIAEEERERAEEERRQSNPGPFGPGAQRPVPPGTQ